MVRKFPGKASGKSENCKISEMRTIQPKIPEIPKRKSNGKEIPGRKFSKIWVYLARLSSFPEIPENAVPFATGNFWKFKPEFLVEWKAP